MIVIGPELGAAKPNVPAKEAPPPTGALRVIITHEYGLPWVTLEYEGKTEELEHEEALAWFERRGASDMDKVNEAINYALNFYRAEVFIAHPVKVERLPGEPEV